MENPEQIEVNQIRRCRLFNQFYVIMNTTNIFATILWMSDVRLGRVLSLVPKAHLLEDEYVGVLSSLHKALQ